MDPHQYLPHTGQHLNTQYKFWTQIMNENIYQRYETVTELLFEEMDDGVGLTHHIEEK